MSLAGTGGPPGEQLQGSYYPHWVVRNGDLYEHDELLVAIPAGTVIGVHHHWELGQIQKILDFPSKSFKISWYAESNVNEEFDLTKGWSVKKRIAEARRKQDRLIGLRNAAGEPVYAASRFTSEIELDAARDKTNRQRLKDAAQVKAHGFLYLGKSLGPAAVEALLDEFGSGFVTRVVFEDIVKDPAYRDDAIALAEAGVALTVVVHHCGYDGDPGSDFGNAQTIVKQNFDKPNVEGYFGEPDRFEIVKTFAGDYPAPAQPDQSCNEIQR